MTLLISWANQKISKSGETDSICGKSLFDLKLCPDEVTENDNRLFVCVSDEDADGKVIAYMAMLFVMKDKSLMFKDGYMDELAKGGKIKNDYRLQIPDECYIELDRWTESFEPWFRR